MTPKEISLLLSGISKMEEAYADIPHEVLISEEDLEDWTEKERRAMLP